MKEFKRRVQFFATFSVSLACLSLGVSSAWPSLVLPKFHNNETSVEINEHEIGWMLAVNSPGFVAGSLITRYLSDTVGRRVTLLGSALPIAIGNIIVVFTIKAWLIYVTRFLLGVGTGMISIIVSIYVAEISDKDIRGTLSVFTKIMFNLGNLIIMVIGPFVSYQTLNSMILVLPVIYFLACWWIPESPYFLLKDKKVDQARKELKRLRSYKDDKTLEEDLMQMQSDVRNEMRHSTTAKELFTGKQYRKAIIIATGLKVTQILSGIVTVQQYLGRIMEESHTQMKLATVFIVFGIVRFVVGMISSILVDKVGRRPLFLYSFLGTSISLAIVGVYFFLQEVIGLDYNTLSPYGFVTFAGIIASNIISTIGYNSIIQIVPAEIFPLNVKTVALTSLTIFGGLLGFVVAKGYQFVKDSFGLCGVFLIFAGICFFGALFVFFFVPETKGKSLREIQIQLQGDLYDEAAIRLKQVVTNDTNNDINDLENVEEMKILNGDVELTNKVVEEDVIRNDENKSTP